jgi:tight adherence protein C
MKISQEMIFVAGLFGTVSVLAYLFSGLLFRRDVDPRLQRLRGKDPLEPQRRAGKDVLYPVVNKLGQAAGAPFMPKSQEKVSSLRRKLSYAGLYSNGAMQTIVGLKVILLVAGTAGGYVLGSMLGGMYLWVLTYVGAVAGFMLPTLWLRMRIRSRQASLERALPDTLDLMVVCVEAGLTIDAALQRVGHEILMAHPEISKELGITHMETRIGVPRIDALRNLGQRTGSSALQSLAAMLVQTERFGTSIAQGLRVHAESLRTKRQHAAEEMAAKTTVKLAFPVVLFIFPTLLVVLGGPAFIMFFKSPLFRR